MILKLSDLVESSDLYKEAFTHKSLLASGKNFERLEFLGDSLLGAKITELLYMAYPNHEEGDLSRWKSAIVSQQTLAEICDELELTKYLKCKESEFSSLVKNERIKASLLESLLGAYYFSKGDTALSELVKSLFLSKIEDASEVFSNQDPKTIYQERAQKIFKVTPTYKTLEQTGPSHAPEFVVAVLLENEEIEIGRGKSIKEAQMKAARGAIKKMEKC